MPGAFKLKIGLTGWLGLVELRRVLFQLKKMVKNGHCGNEGLSLAWDRTKVL